MCVLRLQKMGMSHREYGYRRKFRSKTFDNIDRSKNRGGKSQRREEKRREEKEPEEKRCRGGKRQQSRETQCFSNDLWLGRGEK